MTPRERDALSWDGDDDPTLDVGASAADPVDVPEEASESSAGNARPFDLPPGYTAVGRGSDGIGTPDRESAEGAEPAPSDDARDDSSGADEEPAPIGNAALIALGVLGGVYLLYTVGWIVGGLRLQDVIPFLLPETAVARVAYTFALWIAVATPALWFAGTVLLTRRSRTWIRFVWLAVGVVLLVPWPFAMIGAIGQ
ncbi:DNA polymerase III subunit gamma/tau [Microbacterium xanthum]|uniref:DNA polymerase III subunit gamma/tau n=1 Tax=Microbacterium xanthum TaxID=3079794 RepID=UPI002AD49CA9|nr:DNA polymerase III subunit gamma/tau [Microbacterium sp. KSW-48]MDZ8172277.1 DNA polymerase III subunit gamma/tau [Microbacterium sp. KSW-48]